MKVQIYECTSAGRNATNVVELDVLLRYAMDKLPGAEIARLRFDLKKEGKARVDGDGHWFEYERME